MSNSPKGSYYIRVRKTGWYLYHQSYKEGVRHQEPVKKISYLDLGFKTEMSVDEAKARCEQLNKERSFVKEKIRLAGKRVTELRTVNETLFPQALLEAFESLLDEENFGSKEHLEKLKSHFIFVQNMCNALRIMPVEYKDSAKRIYKYFIQKKISFNYASRIISVLNRWGKFYSKQAGAFYDEVLLPRGREKTAIVDAQQTKSGTETELGVRQASRPLTLEKLKASKDKLIPSQFNWLKLSVWFGLRPEEVDCLKDEENYRIQMNVKTKVKVLHVYQSKLQSVAEDQRWKAIPIIFDEQEECIDIIINGDFDRPLDKTMRKYVGPGITGYGGRKAFVDLMLDRDQEIEDISMWLGHTNIEITWSVYKDRKRISFNETPKTKKSKKTTFYRV